MNTKLRKEAKNEFEKDVFKLMNNSVFGKRWKMLENIRILNQQQQKKRIIKLVSEPNYHTTRHFSEN